MKGTPKNLSTMLQGSNWPGFVRLYGLPEFPGSGECTYASSRSTSVIDYVFVSPSFEPLISDFVASCVSLKKEMILNHSTVSEFVLLEFSEIRELQILHFILFLVWYFATVTGNLLIIFAVVFVHHLHTPMYFFLMNLAISDIGLISAIVPKSMANSFTSVRLITYSGCVAQVFFYVLFIVSDFYLLTVMAYDRYVAICNPLHYEMVMNRERCLEMVSGVWIGGLFLGVLHTSSILAMPFCSNIVNQFFCEIPQLLKLTCSDLYLIELGAIAFSSTFGFSCCIFILVSYVLIFTVVLRMPSAQGRKKAFSTCLPHLIIFSTFVVTSSFAYFRPPSNGSSPLDVALSITYSMVPPLLNPVIYSMRNKEIKAALSKLLSARNSSRNLSFHFLR
ncbi:olfactory receptor 14J1-like [Tiliqua scincoides]|uniref:olfactory receptor 14J1-like n=1 Tax=Tiliqua scincoides TaxID=71010 RepID=UPI0034630596